MQIKTETDILKVDSKRKCYVFNGHYDIGFDQVDNPMKLIHWLHHMTEKVWFNSDVCNYFIECVARQNGWDIFNVKGVL